MNRSKLVTAALLLVATAWGIPTFAQSDRGTITGTVTGPSGAVVSDATVTATDLATGAIRTTTTSDTGSYTLPELPAAPYSVVVDVPGFKAETQNVTLPVQETLRVDFHLVVGSKGESVTVTNDAPLLQAESAVTQTNVTEKQVRELPLQVGGEFGGRTPLSFIFLDSSVTSGTAAGAGEGTGRG